jgi:hypothetical protein
MNRKWMMGAIVASTLGAIPLASMAAVYVDIAPPAPRVEVVPAARPGYVWAPGHYEWRRGEYRWVSGHYIREVRGKYYHPAHWVERDGRWVYVEPGFRAERFAHNENYRGYAYRDRDHDGVPNGADRDRDGDGVPNKYDRAPDNPNRR